MIPVKYVGCLAGKGADPSNYRDYSKTGSFRYTYVPLSWTMTINKCVLACFDFRYKLAALQVRGRPVVVLVVVVAVVLVVLSLSCFMSHTKEEKTNVQTT